MHIIWFNIDQQHSITLTEADKFVLTYMLGMVGQGHGHVRVRNLVGSVKYLRLAYGLSLADAKKAAETFEEEYKLA
jgi:hypothetical protein